MKLRYLFYLWLILTAILLTVAVTLSHATEVPKQISDRVKFVGFDSTGQNRFLEALTLAANTLNVSDKPMPRVLVVHVDKDGGKMMNVGPQRISAVSITPTDGTEKWYTVFFVDDIENWQYANASVSLLAENFGITHEVALAAVKRVADELAATISVEQDKKQWN